MNEKKVDQILISILCIVMILLTGFNYLMNYLGFCRTIIHTSANEFYIVSNEYVQQFEYALEYGKEINNFYGAQNLIEENLQKLQENIQEQDIKSVYILDKSLKLLYKTEGASIKGNLSTLINSNNYNDKYIFKRYEGDYYILMPIKSEKEGQSEKEICAYYGVQIAGRVINHQIKEHLVSGSILGISLILVGVVLIAASIKIYSKKLKSSGMHLKNANKRLQRLGLIMGILIIGVIQLIGQEFVVKSYKNHYESYLNKDLDLVSETLGDLTNRVISKGISYKQISNLEEWTNAYVKDMDEIDKVVIEKGVQAENAIKSSYRLKKDKKGEIESLSVYANSEYIQQKQNSILFQGLCIISISVIILIEIKKNIQKILDLPRVYKNRLHRDLYNNFSKNNFFIFFLGIVTSISLCLIPIIDGKLINHLNHKYVTTGFTVAAYFIGIQIGKVIGKSILRKITWLNGLRVGLLTSGIGIFLGALTNWSLKLYYISLPSNTVEFLWCAQSVAGIGLGIASEALKENAFVEDKKKHVKIFKRDEAISYAMGVCVAAVFGSLIYKQLGYASVLIIASMMCLLLMIFTEVFFKKVPIRLKMPKTKSIYKQYVNLRIIEILGLITVPTACFSLFAVYYLPIYVVNQNLEVNSLGGMFLVYGLVFVASEYLLKYIMENSFDLKKVIYLIYLGLAMSLILFAVLPHGITLVSMIIALALSNHLGLEVQRYYLEDYANLRHLNELKVVRLFSCIKIIASILGTIILSIYIKNDIIGNIGIVGIIIFCMLIGAYLYELYFKKQTSLNERGKGFRETL